MCRVKVGPFLYQFPNLIVNFHKFIRLIENGELFAELFARKSLEPESKTS